jgi:MOSC domain-containing protein YiiM
MPATARHPRESGDPASSAPAERSGTPASAGVTAGVLSTVLGTLAGIARHGRPKGPMETVDHVEVTLDGGIHGDFRGTIKPGGKGRRQVTLIERTDWEAAMAEVGHSLPWFERRSNLLVEGLDLPQIAGTKVRIGDEVVLVITRETDPCERMEALAPGLKAALLPDWRGGACSRVLVGGIIRVGDSIRVEP